MDSKISVKNLSYSVDNQKILQDICFNVEKNQFIGIIGPNGSGKTTLLKHLYRALPAHKKTVYINGRELESYSYKESARQITVMRQENGTDFDYTILEIVMMGRAPYKKYYENDSVKDKEIALNALKHVGMDAFANRSFVTLSGGEKQRVLIARSLAQEADILILDEPTNHLDVHYQWLIMDIISKLGKTVLSVFHELNLACRYCDYLYVLKNGSINAYGNPRAVITPQMLSDVFEINADILTAKSGKPYIVFNGIQAV